MTKAKKENKKTKKSTQGESRQWRERGYPGVKNKHVKKAHVFVKKHLKKATKKVAKKLDKKIKITHDDNQEQHVLEKNHYKNKDTQTTLTNHVEEQLTNIYENSDGSMPDMTLIDLEKSDRSSYALISLLLATIFFAVVIWFGFFATSSNTQFTEEDVVVSVSSEESIVSGEEVKFRVRYRNAQKIMLRNVSVNVRYPEGFVFTKSSVAASNETNDTWEIGTLNKEDGGFIDIYGRIYSDIHTDQSLRVFLNYIPENFTSEFQKVDHTEFITDKKPFELDVKVGDSIISGVKTPININVNKKQDITDQYSNVYVSIESAGVFSKESSKPKSDALDQYRWTLDQTKQKNDVLVTGTFSVTDDENNMVYVVVSAKPATGTIDLVELDRYEIPITVSKTELSAQLIVNGTTGALTMQPGEKMITSFVIKNNGEQAINDVQLRLRIDAPSANRRSIMKWSEVVDIADGDIVGEQLDDATRRGVITWTDKHIPDLQRLDPGEEEVVDIELPIKDSDDVDLTSFSIYNMALVGQMQYTVGGERKTVGSNPIDVTIQSDLTFESEVESSEKNYDLSWLLTNSFHELKNIKIVTSFFGDVSIDQKSIDNAPAGKIEYDKKKQKLTWNIETMPVVIDVLAHKLNVTLDKKKSGQTQLTDKIRLDALDSVTGEKILIVLDPILISNE